MASKPEHMEIEENTSDIDSGLEVEEYEKRAKHTRMEISDYEHGCAYRQKENSSTLKEASNWQNSQHATKIQPDGEKGKNKHSPKREMSTQEKRWETFKTFPAVALVKRLCDNGYYFTGKNDTTVCYSCGAEVTKWENNDDPSIFHDTNCAFNSLRISGQEKIVEFQEISMGEIHSSEFCESILDAPITVSNTNSFPEPLRPEMAEKSISPNPSIVSESNRTNNSDVEISRENDNASTSRNVLSLPNAVAEFEPLHSEESNTKKGEKIVPKKIFVAKKEKPLIVLGDVLTNHHQQLLLSLDLYTEEDRRKTFSANNNALKNFQNVVSYEELAQDGFFYLGNDVRTQCFSCQKVFKIWVSGDKVRQVHMECVPYCRMANGNETLNVPLPAWQRGSSSGHSSLDNYSNHSEASASVMESSHNNSQIPSHTSQSIVTHAPVYTTPGTTSERKFKTQIKVNDEKYGKGDPVPSEQLPLDLSRPNQAISTNKPHVGIPMISPTPGGNVDKSFSKALQSRVVKMPEISSNMEHSETRDNEETIPSVLIRRSSSSGNSRTPSVTISQNLDQTSSIHSPTFEPQDQSMPVSTSSLPSTENISEEIPTSHQEETEFHGTQVQDEEENSPPISPIPNSLHSTSSNEPLPSHHLGQTSLYNPTARNDPADPVPSGQNVFNPVSTSSESPWATIFPCMEPARPDLANAISRQETYNYAWPSGNVNASIDEFARAGFYYTGEGDHLKCWYCHGGISNWDRDDDPWTEHARIFPQCEYVLQQKGPEFVSEISSRYRDTEARHSPVQFYRRSPSSSSNSSEPGSPIPSRVLLNILGNRIIGGNPFETPSTPPRVLDPRIEEDRKRRELELAMASEPVMQAVEMGFEMRKIKKILKRKIDSSGSSFASSEALMEGLLEAPSNISSSSEEEEELDPSTSAPARGSETSTSSAQHLFTTQVPYEKKPSPLEGAEDLDPRALDSRLRQYQQEKRCKVCLDRDADVVFDPCFHLCTCVQCAENLRNCPMCRKKIKRSMRVYTS